MSNKPFTKEVQKKLLIDKITSMGGCKAMELAADNYIVYQCEDISKLIEELVKEKKIIEIEYCLPNMSYRCKSFLLPSGTETVFRFGNIETKMLNEFKEPQKEIIRPTCPQCRGENGEHVCGFGRGT